MLLGMYWDVQGDGLWANESIFNRFLSVSVV